ncbi:nonribosomal peptide synthetase [Bacillus sp. CGMCC 1.16607]|uniref:SF0329 family protein n=1 Tax=Bacillus sp. CGMCC 1.16607 TaxID=3351842 RepID=UPI003627142B
MQWSKTKATLEGFLCDSLRGRIKIYATIYRKFHDGPSRVWITFDKREILSGSDVSYSNAHEKIYQQIKEDRKLKRIPYNTDFNVRYNSLERKELTKASDDAEEILIKQSIFESYHLFAPFMKYSSLSIEDVLKSENIIIRAFSMLDKRLGKRRLKELNLPEGTHPLILEFYHIRCSVDGINT